MRIMDPEFGDKNVQIDKKSKADVAKAEKLFNKKLKEKFFAYGYKKGSKVATLMKKFSTDFTRIVMRPPVGGG